MDVDALHSLHKAAISATASGLTFVAASPLARFAGDVARDWIRDRLKRRVDQSDQKDKSVASQLAELSKSVHGQDVRLARVEGKIDLLVHTLIQK
jgi:hypothetical protein